MKINQLTEPRHIGRKKTKVEKPVVIPVNLPKRNYTFKQWRLYINSRIIKRNGCWLWRFANSRKPYGQVLVPLRDGTTKHLLPARVALWANGESKGCKVWEYEPETRFNRTCGNRNCVNPRHLQPQD